MPEEKQINQIQVKDIEAQQDYIGIIQENEDLKSKLKGSSQSLNNYSLEISKLQSDINITVRNYETKIKEYIMSYEATLSKMKYQHHSEIATLKHQIDIMNEQFKMSDINAKTLKEFELLYQSKIEELQKSFKERENEIMSYKDEHQKLIMTSSHLQKENEESKQCIANLKTQCSQFESECAKLISGSVPLCDVALWAISKQEYDTLLTAYKNKIGELQNTLEDLANKNKSLMQNTTIAIVMQDDMNISKDNSEQLRESNNKLQQETTTLKNQYGNIIDGYIKLLEEDHMNYNILLNKYKTETENYKTEINQLNSSFLKITNQLNECKKQNEEVTLQKDNLSKENDKINLTIAGINASIPTNAETNDIKSRLLEYSLRIQKYEHITKALESDIESYADQREELKQLFNEERKQFSETIQKLSEENKLYFAQLESKYPSLISSLSVDISNEANNEFGAIVKYLKTENDSLQRNLNDLRENYRKLLSSSNDFKHQEVKLKAELDSYKKLDMMRIYEDKEIKIQQMDKIINEQNINVEGLHKALQIANDSNSTMGIQNNEYEGKIKQLDLLYAKSKEDNDLAIKEIADTKEMYEKKIKFIGAQYKELTSKIVKPIEVQKPSEAPDARLKKMMATLRNAKKVVEIQSKCIDDLSHPEKRKKTDS